MRPFLVLALVFVPYAAAGDRPTEVAILGALHGSHLHSKRYSVQTVIETIRRYKPQVVFVEIPPHLYARSVARVDRTGFATRRKDLADLPWIPSFPELYAGVLPLRKELGYAVEPVSGWREEVSADRRAFWKGPGKEPPFTDRRRIYDAVKNALNEIRKRERHTENPRFVNSQHYADLMQLERTAWSACFDEGLGRGGEAAINRAHFRNISRALEKHKGKRVLIVYGAAHRYWFLRELRKRKDVAMVDIVRFLP